MAKTGRVGFLLLAVVLVSQPSGAAEIEPAHAARNATLVFDQNFPDPSVLVVGHTSYAYSTNSDGLNLPVIESTGLTEWTLVGDAMSVLPAWALPGSIWGPSVSAAPGGGYQVFFSAYDPKEGVECLGRASSASTLGPFVDVSGTPFLCQASTGGSIDPSIYASAQGDYLVWKADGEGGQTQALLAARLTSADTGVVGTPATLLTATHPWEAGVVEGPDLVDLSGQLYLFFSANAWSTGHYGIADTRCTTPLGPCDATAAHEVFQSSATITGPGGPTWFTAQGRHYMAFAAWTDGVVGNASGHRALFISGWDMQQGVGTFAAVAGSSDADRSASG